MKFKVHFILLRKASLERKIWGVNPDYSPRNLAVNKAKEK
jgi:hypothetical protein